MALFYITNQESLALTLFLLWFHRRKKKLRREDSRPKNSYPQPKNSGCELSLDYGVSTLTSDYLKLHVMFRIFSFKITLITYQFRSAVFVLQLR